MCHVALNLRNFDFYGKNKPGIHKMDLLYSKSFLFTRIINFQWLLMIEAKNVEVFKGFFAFAIFLQVFLKKLPTF